MAIPEPSPESVRSHHTVPLAWGITLVLAAVAIVVIAWEGDAAHAPAAPWSTSTAVPTPASPPAVAALPQEVAPVDARVVRQHYATCFAALGKTADGTASPAPDPWPQDCSEAFGAYENMRADILSRQSYFAGSYQGSYPGAVTDQDRRWATVGGWLACETATLSPARSTFLRMYLDAGPEISSSIAEYVVDNFAVTLCPEVQNLPSAPVASGQEPAAKDDCKARAYNRLKAPSTAEFGDFIATELPSEPGAFFVDASFDAQNSFGAMLRGTVRCSYLRTYYGDPVFVDILI